MREIYKQQLSPAIESESLPDHKEKVEEELRKIQLYYADQIYHSRAGSQPDQKFSDILKEIDSDLIKDLSRCLRNENNNQISDEDLNKILASHDLEEIDRIYKSASENTKPKDPQQYFLERETSLQPILDYVRDKEEMSKDKFRSSWQEYEAEADLGNQNKAGIFEFNLLDENNNRINEDLVGELVKAGYSKSDDFLEIHIPDIFAADKPFGPETVKESLSKLAETIVDKYPQTRAIVGVSWLLGHRAVKRVVDFQILKEGAPNWRQLIDKEGQIDQNKLKVLVEKNELPYKNLYGYLDTEDFLRRFLPAERKGRITLKTVNEDWLEKNGDYEKLMKEDSRKFAADWDQGKLHSREDLLASLERAPHFKDFLERAGIFSDLVRALESSLEKTREEFNKKNLALLAELNEKSQSFFKELKKSKYLDKEVII